MTVHGLSGEARPVRSVVVQASYTYTNADERNSILTDGTVRSIRVLPHSFTAIATYQATRRLQFTADFLAGSEYVSGTFFVGTGTRPYLFPGPKKLDLANWRSRPVWADASRCLVSMNGMPYDGGTFADVEISEGGRRLLGERMRQISAEQISALFAAAGVENVPEWTAAFQDKVRQIAARPSCPVAGKIAS